MITYKEPIKVICVKSSSKRLICGGVYLATSLSTHKWSNITKRTISIKNVGSYNINYFTLQDGSSLDNYEDFSIEQNRLDLDNKDYSGQYVRCMFNSGKSFKDGEIYFVEKHETSYSTGYKGIKYPIHKFKIKGIYNLINPFRFLEIPIAEQRKIKLKNLKGEKTKTGNETRKFLLFSKKEQTIILYELLCKTLNTLKNVKIENTNNLIIQLMKNQGKNYGITEEEINLFLNEKNKDLLNIF